MQTLHLPDVELKVTGGVGHWVAEAVTCGECKRGPHTSYDVQRPLRIVWLQPAPLVICFAYLWREMGNNGLVLV